MSDDVGQEEGEGGGWNYRIVRLKNGWGFTICSVSFDNVDGPFRYYGAPNLVGETVEELKENYELIREAFDRPPIDPPPTESD
jgi:hypothetical protein